MMTPDEGAAPDTVETTPAPPSQAGFSSDDADDGDESDNSAEPGGSSEDDAAYEQRAREMGWKPASEWKGQRPDRMMSAREFVEHGERMIPVLKSQLARKDEEFQKRIERIERANERALKAIQAENAKRIAELENAQRWAAHNGKAQEYDAYTQQLAEARQQAAIVPTELLAPDGADPRAQVAAVEAEWTKRNTWYGSDPEMTSEAEIYSHGLAARMPNLPYEENLRRTEAHMRRTYPQKFAGPNRGANAHAPVDGGGAFPSAPRRATKGFDELPEEAKRAFARFSKDPSIKMTKADYAKEYWAND